ncbi:MAG: sigma-70 family RNA polymerase sigma factor [Bacteroidota bacterium]
MLALPKPLSSNQLKVTPKPKTERNFGLSESSFQEMVSATKDGDHRFFERAFHAHFEDCIAYLRRKDQAEQSEAYDAVMEALLRFRDLLVAGKIRYGNLRYLLTLMARQELRRQRKRQGRFTTLPDLGLDLVNEAVELSEEDFSLLSRAFNSLGEECRELLRGFYYGKRTVKEIAKEAGRKAPAVRKQKSRCIATLRRYFYQTS